jgi:hypothetical protein
VTPIIPIISFYLELGGKIPAMVKESEPMSTPKAEVSTLLESLPDDTSLEDIQYHLYVLEKVKMGVDRAENEGGVSHEEVRQRLSKWLDS